MSLAVPAPLEVEAAWDLLAVPPLVPPLATPVELELARVAVERFRPDVAALDAASRPEVFPDDTLAVLEPASSLVASLSPWLSSAVLSPSSLVASLSPWLSSAVLSPSSLVVVSTVALLSPLLPSAAAEEEAESTYVESQFSTTDYRNRPSCLNPTEP